MSNVIYNRTICVWLSFFLLSVQILNLGHSRAHSTEIQTIYMYILRWSLKCQHKRKENIDFSISINLSMHSPNVSEWIFILICDISFVGFLVFAGF